MLNSVFMKEQELKEEWRRKGAEQLMSLLIRNKVVFKEQLAKLLSLSTQEFDKKYHV